jgi:hypothetical protein
MAAMAASLRPLSVSFRWSKRGTLEITGGLTDRGTGGHITGSSSCYKYKNGTIKTVPLGQHNTQTRNKKIAAYR